MNKSLKSIIKNWWWNARVTAFAVGTAVFIKIATKLMYEMQDVFEADAQNLGLKCQYNNPAKGTKYEQVVKELTKRTGVSVNLWDEDAEVTFVSPVLIRFAELVRTTFKSLFGLDYVRVTVDDPKDAENNYDIVIQKRNADAPEVKIAKLREDLLSILDTSYGSEERLKGEVLHAVLETFVAEGQELPIRPKEEFGGKRIMGWRESVRMLSLAGKLDYDITGLSSKSTETVLAELKNKMQPDRLQSFLFWISVFQARRLDTLTDMADTPRPALRRKMKKHVRDCDRAIYTNVERLSNYVCGVLA